MMPASSRIDVIDAIRGVALCGILIFNIQTYALFTFLEPRQVYELGLDRQEVYASLQFIIHLFVNGQFYTIYSFLFGLGFYMLWKKNKGAGLDADRIFKRRLWILLLMGLIHGLLFWFGDILHKYALFGFTLLYFNRKSVTTLLKWIVSLMIFSIVLQIILIFAIPPSDSEGIDPIILQVINTWQYGTFTEVVALQKLGVAMLWIRGVMGGMSSMILYLVMFLLGLAAGKTDFFSRLSELKPRLQKLLLFTFPLAILLKSVAHLDILGIRIVGDETIRELASSLAIFLAVPLLTVSYLIGLSMVLSRGNDIFIKWIANAGRMGLTNYLMQTLICMLLFYGYAGSLSGKVTLLQTFGLAIAIFSFQVLYSNIWFKYYKVGPMEKLWRKLSSS